MAVTATFNPATGQLVVFGDALDNNRGQCGGNGLMGAGELTVVRAHDRIGFQQKRRRAALTLGRDPQRVRVEQLIGRILRWRVATREHC